MDYQVLFVVEQCRVNVAEGKTLLDAQILANLPTDAPCGGKGTCKKCAVEYRKKGKMDWRRELACRVRVDADMEVRLLHGSERLQVLTDGADGVLSWDPMVKVRHVHVDACKRGESTSDWSRLCAALGGVWQPNLRLCKGLGKLLKENQGDLWAVVSGDHVLQVLPHEPQVYMAAFDLGTTSIAGYLIHVNEQRVVLTGGMRNPQAQYGGDVISRADYALEHGSNALADCAREAIDDLLSRMCVDADISRETVYAVLVAGNTAMHHLF